MNRDNDTLWKMAASQLIAEKYNANSEQFPSHVHKRFLALKKSKEFTQRMLFLAIAKPHSGETLATGFRK
jgi:ribosomal protein S10